jgi:anti-sigma factor RsiW
MNACPDKALLLQGLLDGELDAVNAAACEAHLKTCEGCEAEFRRLQALRETVAAPGVAYRAPESLRAGIETMLAAETAPASQPAQGPRRRFSPWAAGGLGGLGGLLAAGLAVMLVLPPLTEAGVERQLVASHVRSLMASHLTDVATSNRHVVKPWFNGKAEIAPPVPDLADQGFPLVGGRLDYVDGHVAPAIVYSRRLHTVNLFVWGAGGLTARTRTVRRDGYSLVEWTDGGLRFAAVSDIDPGELRQFKAAYVAHATDAPH